MAGSAKPSGVVAPMRPATVGNPITPQNPAALFTPQSYSVGGQQPSVMPQPPVPPSTAQPSVMPAAPAQPNIFQQSAGAYGNAINAANAAAAYRPQSVAAERVGTTFGYTPETVAAQTALGGIQQYFNPYEQQVVDLSLADLERQRMMQMAQMGAQASAAGAFGGSRQGVAQALTNEAFANQGGQLAAQLRQQGFTTALGASQQDVANQMQAALANQAARASQEQFAQGTRLQAQQANQQAASQAAQANQAAALQAANLRASAAGQLGNLSQTGFNMGNTITQQQMQQGAMQQAMNQALIDAAKGQYTNFTGAPQNSLATVLAGLSGADMGQQTTTQKNNPGLLQYLTLGLGSLSDIRLKENIKPVGNAHGVQFYTWDWNEEGKRIADPKQPKFGVIADEMALSHPQHVSRGKDGYLRVNYTGLIEQLRAN